MDRNILNQRGFSLLELSIVMGVAAVLATALIPIAVRTIEIKAAEKAVTEVALIQVAAAKFYNDNKLWPVNLTQLQEQRYLSPRWSLLNPWNNPYQIVPDAKTLAVTTTVPSNLVKMLAFRLPQSSINGNTVSSAIGSGKSDAIAAGVIVAWSGPISDIPFGWALCDGNNNTPDLRDKFIVGAREDEGGVAKTQVLSGLSQTGGTTSHNHVGTTGIHVLAIDEIPPHSHGYYKPIIGGRYDGHSSPLVTDMSWEQTATVGRGQGHSHAISSDYHVPPYYALAFIMKLL